MAEATTSSKAKAKPASFDSPKYDTPEFEASKTEIPVAFREFAELGVAKAKETYDKMKSAAEESTAVLEDTCTTAAKGVTAYNLKVIEAARTNANAAFDFAREFAGVKSLSEAVELSSAHARKQFESFSAQSKELTALAQKVVLDSAEPIKSGFSTAFGKVA